MSRAQHRTGDYEAGIDRIDLSAFGFSAWIDGDAFSGTAGELRYEGNLLEGDLDGDLVADFAVRILGDSLSAADFIL